MRRIKKLISMIVCLCVSVYTMPVFAMVSVDAPEEEAMIVQLDEATMAGIVGAGAYDVSVTDYHGGPVGEAVFVNRGGVTSTYYLEETDANGNVLNTIETGHLSTNQGIVVTGPMVYQTTNSSYMLRGRLVSHAWPEFKVIDNYMH